MLKLCFSTLGCPELDLDGIIALALKTGTSLLEFRGISGEEKNDRIADFTAERLAATKEKLDAASLKAQVIGTSCSFHDRTPGKLDASIEEGILSARIAAALGAKYIRVFGNKMVDENSPKDVADGIATLCSSIPEGVTVLLEDHGDFNSEPTLGKVCDALAGRHNFGLVWDIWHSDVSYGDRWPEFYERFKPLIRHIHMKDAKEGYKLCLPGEGTFPVVPVLKALDADRFGGAVSLEWERKWHPELEPLDQAMEAFKKLAAPFTA